MSITYRTLSGDTFESIARKVYGDDLQASRIAGANPGAPLPLAAGTLLVIPDAIGPTDTPQGAPADNNSETALSIDGVRFRFWQDTAITRSVDAFDTIAFKAPFDANDAAMRDIFKPLSYKPLSVTVGGSPLFSGVLVGVLPVLGVDSKTLALDGYATPGTLNDCMPSAASYPLEFNNQNLNDITVKLLEPYGVTVEFRGDPGAAFNRVACAPDRKILDFLIDLAKQRGYLISSTPRGALLFHKPTGTGRPVARLKQGIAPLGTVTPQFNPQEYYSHVTGLEPVEPGRTGTQYTAKNERLTSALRALVFNTDDVEGGDVKSAVQAKLGRMIANAVSYVAPVATWHDAAGNLWQPGEVITLEAPDAMIYSEYTLMIRSVTFTRGDTESAALSLVLPQAYTGGVVESVPWD